MQQLFLILFFIAQPTFAKLELRYSSEISPMESARIEGDLQYLSGVQFEDSNGELKKQFALMKSDSENMQHWLSLRARYIISTREKIDHDDIEIGSNEVSYPNNELPFFVDANNFTEDFKVKFSTIPVMQNLGGFLYLYAKALKRGVIINIEGIGPVPVSSPRMGLFVAGEKFFAPFDPRLEPEVVIQPGHRLYRLSTLVHEARHGDGNRKTMSFPHVLCPRGHEFRGLPVCDGSSNGSYGLEATFIRSALSGCTECNEMDKAFLNMLYVDSKSRVVGDAKWNPIPEYLLEQ